MNNRLIAISDIHGYYDAFVSLLKKINYDKDKDTLVIVGDMVDRGPESMKVISLIRNMQLAYPDKVHVVLGNHDSEFIKIAKLLQKGQTLTEEDWQLYAGFTGDDLTAIDHFHKLFSFADKEILINWLNSLPTYVDICNHIFVHAGIDPTIPMVSQNEQKMLWGKYDKDDRMFIWKNVNKNHGYENKVVVFGHLDTAVIFKKYENRFCHDIWYDLTNYDKIGIDCGAGGNGKLGALIISRDNEGNFQYNEEYIVPEKFSRIEEKLQPRKKETTSTMSFQQSRKR